MADAGGGSDATEHARNSPDVNKNDGIPTVVVNEFLCFVHNKMNILPSETIVQLCSKHYRTEEIEIAKKKLCEVCPTDTRVLNRKGPKKNVQNLDDVVKRLNELDPESDVIPCFVARDLGNLPPITFNSIDVSVLLAKIESMHDEVQLLRAGMTCQQTTAETLKQVCEETVSRMDMLESKTSGLSCSSCDDYVTRNTESQHVNPIINEGCQMTVELHPVAASVDSARAPVPVKAVNSVPVRVNSVPVLVNNTPATVPVETGINSTRNDERWSTVVRKGVKRRATPEVDIQRNPLSPVTRMKQPVIGRAKVAGIVAAERRKKKANIFASRFARLTRVQRN